MSVIEARPTATATEQSGANRTRREPVPLEPYRSAAFFEVERERIFRRAWLNVGRTSDVANPGDFIVREVEVLKASVLITRTRDNEIRAFHNVCPHRGNRVVNSASGNAPAFVCGYHAWSFGNDGSLRGVPDQEMFLDFDKTRCGLRPIAIDSFEGWLFINLADPPEITLRDYLGEFGDYISGLENINEGPTFILRSHLKCNWKVASDAFLEGYHIQAIHSSTLKTMYSRDENRFGRLLQIRRMGPHSLNSMYGNPAHVPGSHEQMERIAYDPAALPTDRIEAMGRFMQHPAVNPTRSPNWSMDKHHVFPNTQFDFGPTGFWMHQFWPISVNETRHEACFYLSKPTSARHRFAQEYNLAHAADIVLEDLTNVERTQLGIESRAFDGMPLSESELLIRYSVDTVLKWAAAETVAEAMTGYEA